MAFFFFFFFIRFLFILFVVDAYKRSIKKSSLHFF